MWSDHVALRLEIASVGGTGPGSPSKWSAPSDAYKSRWTPAPTDAGGEPGKWLQTIDIRTATWTDWSTIPWVDILCEAMSANCAQGWSPFAWNASPNSASFVLVDPAQDYLPYGPDGKDLDIGFDLPIRLVADWHDSQGGIVTVWAGLVRTVVWSATPGGERRATIRATEISEVYGRTDPPDEGAVQVPDQTLAARLAALHNISDMPNLFPQPVASPPYDLGPNRTGGPDQWTPPTAWSSLKNWTSAPGWSCESAALNQNVWSDICHWINAHGLVSVTLNYPIGLNDSNNGVTFHTPRVRGAVPLPVRYPHQPNLVIADTCSDPDGYPWTSDITASPTIRISPKELRIESSQADIDNIISIAFAGTTDNQATLTNQASVDAYGRHTYGRNDLKLQYQSPNATPRDAAEGVAWRLGLRSSMARDKLETLEFPVSTRRDLQALVGHKRRSQDSDVHPSYGMYVMQPTRAAVLEWVDPAMADHALLVTKVEHSISPTSWTTKLGCEMFDMDHYYGKDNP